MEHGLMCYQEATFFAVVMLIFSVAMPLGY